MQERKIIRLRGYDYSSDNLYFVTSCVHNQICCFGKIIDGIMILNDYGKIAEKQWRWLGKQYPYIILHEFVIMPDHMHGIIEINRDHIRTGRVRTGRDQSVRDQSVHIKIKSLSELIGAYKTTVSKQIHQSGCSDFKWQRSFYEHIIRNKHSFENISNYIKENPAKWSKF